MSASRFKAHCFRLMEDVVATGEPLIVTKRGRPVVRVVPSTSLRPRAAASSDLVDGEELMAPIDVTWDAET